MMAISSTIACVVPRSGAVGVVSVCLTLGLSMVHLE